MSDKTKVILIDDHPLMRRGIKQLLELDESFEVIGDAGSGSEGVNLALQLEPDLIILDLNMKGLSGLDTLKALRTEGIDARI
ncbi:response regulator, partial [Tessaracoccus sp. OH4464_COT-324]